MNESQPATARHDPRPKTGKGSPLASLRRQLILLVLIGLVPALGLVLYSGLRQHRHEKEEAQEYALILARNIAILQMNRIEDARQILFTLSLLPEVRKLDGPACSAIFGDLMKQNEAFANLVATLPNGDVLASGHPLGQRINFADRPWFQRLFQSRDFVVSEYLVSRITGKPIISLSYPMRDAGGEIRLVLSATLDLRRLHESISPIELPPGTLVTMVDGNGTVLSRHPDPTWIGRPMPEAALLRRILSQEEGVEEGPAQDGTPYLFGFTLVGQPSGAFFVSVGIPRKVGFAPANRIIYSHLLYLGVVAFLSLLAAWFGANRFLLRPIERLLAVTRRLASGDLSARAGAFPEQREIGRLAEAFDGMAEGLQARETERRKAEEQIRNSLQEKEVLLKEIHHRVKNNLQVISSLLRLQSRTIAERKTRGIFQESQDRIRSMALIHEMLYQSQDLVGIDFRAYIRNLTVFMYHSHGVDGGRIRWGLEGEGIFLGIDSAIPCGLILNELLSNSLKHAFPDGRTGEIAIFLGSSAGRIILGLRDNGVGLPEGLDFRRTESLGLQLVVTLVDQLEGTIALSRTGGTEFRIDFPEERRKR